MTSPGLLCRLLEHRWGEAETLDGKLSLSAGVSVEGGGGRALEP